MFIRAPNPIWWIPDHTGVSLNDEYWAFFKTNTFPYLPQPVYTTPNGTPWTNPIQFQPSGTLPNNLYFDPSLTYRIEIRHGNTQADQLIWLIENFQPGNAGSIIENNLLFSENMLTNPQFADTYFNLSYTFTAAGTYDIAPGWQIVLVGSGSTTITQGSNSGIADTASTDVSLPPTYIDFSSSGWTSVTLNQTFTHNGFIFNKGAIAAAVTARSTTNPTKISISYVPSGGTSPVSIISNETVSVGAFNVYKNAVNINPLSTNPDIGNNASVTISIALPPNGDIAISNLQIVGQNTPLSSDFVSPDDAPDFQPITYEREVDHEFNVYRESLLRQPKNTLLAGWEFGLNPWQFYSTTHGNVATNEYTADQTILIQQNYVATATGNNVAVSRAGFTENQGFKVTAVTAANQFGILQYIDPNNMIPNWNAVLSSMVKAFINTSNGSQVKFKVRLIYRDTLPASTAQHYPVLSWAAGTPSAGTDPVFHSDFVVIKPNNDPVYTLTSVSDFYPFEGMTLPVSPNNTSTVGLFVYLYTPMSIAGTPDYVVFEDVSLVKNDFAIQSNSKTFDEVLRDCQFYYQKTYKTGDLPGTLATDGTVTNAVTYKVFDAASEPAGAMWYFKTTLRAVPTTITFYNPVVSAVTWRNQTAGSNSDNGTWDNLGTDSVMLVNGQSIGGALNVGDQLSIHATVDVRLGV